MQGTPPTEIPVYVPAWLPSSPVYTTKGWMFFDEWGRPTKLCPQPDPADNYSSLVVLCSYADIKKKFPYLPPVPMSTDATRKRRAVAMKKKRCNYFLPHTEKRQIEINEQNAERAKKMTKAQVKKRKADSAAFQRAFPGPASIGGAAKEKDPTGKKKHGSDPPGWEDPSLDIAGIDFLPSNPTDASDSDSDAEAEFVW